MIFSKNGITESFESKRIMSENWKNAVFALLESRDTRNICKFR